MVRYYLLQWNHILSLYNTWCEKASRKSGALSPSFFLPFFNLLVIEINRIIYTSTRTVLRPVSTGTLRGIGVDNSTIDDVGTTTGITTVPTARLLLLCLLLCLLLSQIGRASCRERV